MTATGIEPATYCLGNSCSIQLSYAVKNTGPAYTTAVLGFASSVWKK